MDDGVHGDALVAQRNGVVVDAVEGIAWCAVGVVGDHVAAGAVPGARALDMLAVELVQEAGHGVVGLVLEPHDHLRIQKREFYFFNCYAWDAYELDHL